MSDRILATEVVYSSPWLDVVVKEVDLGPPRGREEFWSVRTAFDYAAVLAFTEEGSIPLVRQFRPAVEETVLELPSGAIDPGEAPEQAIRRELLEETGCEADELVSLGAFHTDSGRMETTQWGFLAPRVRRVREHPVGDEPLELTFVKRGELLGLVASGSFRVAPHVAIVAAALAAGWADV